MATLLLSCFDPFGEDSQNPTALIAQSLHNTPLDSGHLIKTCTLPVVRYAATDLLVQQIAQHQPLWVVCLGQASGRTDITPEKVAINLDDYRIPDNQGNQIIDEPIRADGPTAYFSGLPVKAIVQQIQGQGINASVSYSAGTFVCNHLMYGLLDYINLEKKAIKAGFIHTPALPEQLPQGPNMSLEQQIQAIKLACEAITTHDEDIRLNTGKIA